MLYAYIATPSCCHFSFSKHVVWLQTKLAILSPKWSARSGDIHELHGIPFYARCLQALEKVPCAWSVLVRLDQFPWFKHLSIALALLYNMSLEWSFPSSGSKVTGCQKFVQPRGASKRLLKGFMAYLKMNCKCWSQKCSLCCSKFLGPTCHYNAMWLTSKHFANHNLPSNAQLLKFSRPL